MIKTRGDKIKCLHGNLGEGEACNASPCATLNQVIWKATVITIKKSSP